MANFLFYRYKFVQGPTDASLFPVDSDEPVSGELHNITHASFLLTYLSAMSSLSSSSVDAPAFDSASLMILSSLE